MKFELLYIFVIFIWIAFTIIKVKKIKRHKINVSQQQISQNNTVVNTLSEEENTQILLIDKERIEKNENLNIAEKESLKEDLYMSSEKKTLNRNTIINKNEETLAIKNKESVSDEIKECNHNNERINCFANLIELKQALIYSEILKTPYF